MSINFYMVYLANVLLFGSRYHGWYSKDAYLLDEGDQKALDAFSKGFCLRVNGFLGNIRTSILRMPRFMVPLGSFTVFVYFFYFSKPLRYPQSKFISQR